jgi:acetyl esterase/lipase
MTLKGLLRILLLFCGYVLLIGGIYSGLVIVTGGFTLIDTLLMCALPIFVIYAFFLYPVIMIAMVRLHRMRKGKLWILPIILGVLVLSFCILPFTGIPQTIKEGDTQFAATFGANYMDNIPVALKSKFQAAPFNFWKMYNNNDAFNCNVTKNCGPYLTVPGYNDSFYFDYYCPPSGVGPFPTIINIHGGAWVLGNKGMENRLMASRYLAQQGYVVLDIQYGLGSFPEDSFVNDLLGTVQSLLGREMLNKSYTLSEIAVQVLGNFTDYIAAHALEYKINTSCVYVTGNSAGAHLTGLFLGYNTTYKNIFNHALQLKGLILFYCPSNLTDLFEMAVTDPLGKMVNIRSYITKIFGGTPEDNATLLNMLSPALLVNKWSPPCLILHGEKDKLVPYVEALQLKTQLDANSIQNILLSFPFQGHAFDYSFNSPGGQISLYYFERFLAATQYCI